MNSSAKEPSISREQLIELLSLQLFDCELSLNSLLMERVQSDSPRSLGNEKSISDLQRNFKNLSRSLNKLRSPGLQDWLIQYALLRESLRDIEIQIQSFRGSLGFSSTPSISNTGNEALAF